MAENIDNLILEHLRHLRASNDKIIARLDDLVTQMRVSNTHVASLIQR